MSNSLKKRTSFAIFWSFVDKGGQQLMQLAFSVVLARILLPDEIGTLALLAIFTAVANILQESGFSSALIRKKNPEDGDFASVFYFNITISVSIYAILFFCAPLISNYYDNPSLTPLARIVFLSFVFNSFGLIQNVILVRQMDFKKNTKVTLIAGSISGLTAILLALKGFGVWSLAIQLVLQSFLRNTLLWLIIKWIPKVRFSLSHIKVMASYSSKLLLTSVMNQVCGNIYSNIIGKFFSLHQTGVYSYANKFAIIPQSVISDGIKSAAFPALSKIENDISYTKKAFRKIIRIAAFISFPIAILAIVIAKPTILLLIGEKWAEVIPYFQILAIGGAFYPLYNLVATLLQSLGNTSLILKLEFYRNLLALSLIPITIQYGVSGLVSGISFVSIIAFFTGMTIAGKHIKYNLLEITKDTIPYILIALISIFPFFFMEYLGITNLYALLITPSIAGSLLYLVLLKIAGSVILSESIGFLMQFIKKTKND